MEGWRISVGNWECAVCQIRGNLLVVLMSTVRALLGEKQGTLHEQHSKYLKMCCQKLGVALPNWCVGYTIQMYIHLLVLNV